MSKGKILFQLSGSIACFKACQLLSRLVQEGYEVECVASKAALEFVGKATLEGLTGKPVRSDTFEPGGYMQHIHLIRWADLVLLCPATANTLNKMATGIGDDLLSSLFLAHDFKKPYLVAPAMNMQMLRHPATQESLAKLRDWGVEVLDSGSGALACGENGEGRLLEPEQLYQEVQRRFQTKPPLQLNLLITSGGTREPIDGVRSITNTSTGRTGAALADHFLARGHRVTFLQAEGSIGPVQSPTNVCRFQSFADLETTLRHELGREKFDAVLHAAAVSDYSVDRIDANGRALHATDKIDSTGEIVLRLKPNPKLVDRLREMSSNKAFRVVAFKLTNTMNERARLEAVQKLAERARPDLIVHNDLHEIGASEHFSTLFTGNAEPITTARTKHELANSLEKILLETERRS